MRRAAIRRAMLLAALVLTLQWPHAATQAQDVMYMLKLSIAIRGFDTVSYFTDGEAVKGRSEIASEYGYQKWHFATEDHKRMFEADPARYLPQYGGLSAAELAAGGQQHANPANWVIVDGKLYMVSGGTRNLEAWQRPTDIGRNSWWRSAPGHFLRTTTVAMDATKHPSLALDH